MLRRLRIKFICINMAIVTIMLAVILGLVLHFASQNMEQQSIRMMQAIAMNPFQLGRPNELPDEVRLPYFILQIGPNGELETVGGGYYDLSDGAFLRSLIDTVVSSGKQTGLIKEYQLRFCRIVTPVSQRLVFTDISSEQSTMDSLLKTCVLIGGVSFLVFLLISLFLARWAVGPVAKAWAQQRQFVADASHELKTPLTVILTNAELLNDRSCGETARQRSAQSILTMSVRMRELVEQLLCLARLDSGAAQVAFSRVDISKVASDVLLPFEPLFFEKGLELSSQVEDGLTVEGSEAHLRQVMEILLDNAQKYAVGPSCVSMTLCRKGRNHCLFSVSNHGEAISREDLQNIFKRFYRADKVRTAGHSYGLGLAIASGIVEAHHGKIWAESADGVNTFYVRLPSAAL
ncbi:cell wall metabolism sensor histidine kinase WalK [uncultured Dysosmobacter sp.]|uniref:sensor histidine kinase n=1 Tax=uncultured Dysosmobacter sp. TaxID=2591384 RepID=UPI002613A4C0|nr:HAMP domain-containing sensor histidine kinase [uncultured Dysosmobacter sp.]